jgi:flagellar basal-body rod modification protein FlgD
MTTTIDPISTTSTGASGSTGTTSSSVDNPGAVLDRDAFLKLLVAQLKYQDPTQPADASEMVAQSAQLSMVDELTKIAAQLEANSLAQRMGVASSIVGKEVAFADADGYTQSAVVQSVRLDGDELMLAAGDYAVPLSAVTAIRDPQASTSSTTDGSAP